MYRHMNISCKESKSEIDVLNNKLKELELKLASLENHNNTHIVNNIQNQNIQINIASFGEEKTNHLSVEFLDKCLLGLNNGMKTLMKEIHFNPNVPENHNIRVLSKKQNLLEKYCDGEWHPCDKNNTLDEMIKNGYKILYSHFLRQKIDHDLELIEPTINDYFIKLRSKDNIYYELRRDLYIMILDDTFYVLGKTDDINI